MRMIKIIKVESGEQEIKENETGRKSRQRRGWRRGAQTQGRGIDACFIHSPLTLL